MVKSCITLDPAACLDEVGERQRENVFKMTHLHLTISRRDTSIHIETADLHCMRTLRFLCNEPEQQQTVLSEKQADKEGLEKKTF